MKRILPIKIQITKILEITISSCFFQVFTIIENIRKFCQSSGDDTRVRERLERKGLRIGVRLRFRVRFRLECRLG